MILEAIQKAGYKPGKDIVIMLDPAASEFFDEGNYVFAKSDKSKKTPTEMIALWKSWLKKYPEIWSIEDGRRRGRSCRLAANYQRTGESDPACRRRQLRYESRAFPARHQGWHRQRHSDQVEPDWHCHGDA